MSEFNPSKYNELSVRETVITGLFEIDLVVNGDNRGWFKENYQQAKMEGLGLPHFEPVQNNFSYNEERGVTRGLHAEPWDKFISVANGSVFGAWVDLRPGLDFGKIFTTIIDPGKAIYVPRGVANGYQTLDPQVTYTYLVNDHWSADAKYTFINLFDPELAIDWPIKQAQSIVSEKDLIHPTLTKLKSTLI